MQVLFYCLDCLPIILCLSCYILFHPGYLLPPGGPKAAVTAAGAAPTGAITAADLEASAYSKSAAQQAQQAQQAEQQGQQLQDSPKDRQEDLKLVTVDLHT